MALGFSLGLFVVFGVEEERENVLPFFVCRSDTVVRDGDIIHILLTNPVDNHYHIDNNQVCVYVCVCVI